MQRWHVALGAVLLMWFFLGATVYRALAGLAARGDLIGLERAGTRGHGAFPTERHWVWSDIGRGGLWYYPSTLSRPCYEALKPLNGVYPWPALAVQHAASVCPRATRPLPSDVLLAEQILSPELLSLIGGLLEHLTAKAANLQPSPPENLLREVALELVITHLSVSEDWPAKTEAQGLPTAAYQSLERASQACLMAELKRDGEFLAKQRYRAEILWHPQLDPVVVRSESPAGRAHVRWTYGENRYEMDSLELAGRSTSWHLCVQTAAEKVPSPEHLARFIWITPG